MSVYQRFYHIVQDNQGNVISGATCTVYNVGTDTLSTIYDPGSDDSNPQGISNPFVTGADGKFGFFALDGEYDIQIKGGSLATQTFRVTLSTADAGVGAVASADLANTSSMALGDALVGVKQPLTGAAGITQHFKNALSVYADEFTGVDPTGSDDSATGLQAAITARAGKVLELTPGATYSVGSALTLPVAGIRLRLNGATVKHRAGALHAIFTATSASNIVIEDGVIDGNMANTTTASDRWDRIQALLFTSCTNVLLSRVEIKATKGQAIQHKSCTNFKLHNCHIHDTDDWACVGMNATGCEYVGNHVENVYTHGLYVDGQFGASNCVLITKNKVINAQYDATYSGSGIGISVNATGTPVNEVIDSIITDNIVRNCGNMAFSITGTSTDAVTNLGRVILANNTATGNTANLGWGIEIVGSNVLASGNILDDNNTHVIIDGDLASSNIIISGNRLISTVNGSAVGIRLAPAAVTGTMTNLQVINNNIYGGAYSFNITSTTPTTHHNTIKFSGNVMRASTYGVLIQSSVDNCELTDNTYYGGAATIQRPFQFIGDGITIERNRAVITTSDDIFTVGDASGIVTIKDNYGAGSGNGISCGVTVTKMTLSGNDVSGCSAPHDINGVTTLRDIGDNSWNFGTATPVAKRWQVGQRVQNTASAVGQPKAWVCTVAGIPGTWVSEGNL